MFQGLHLPVDAPKDVSIGINTWTTSSTRPIHLKLRGYLISWVWLVLTYIQDKILDQIRVPITYEGNGIHCGGLDWFVVYGQNEKEDL